MPSQRVSSAPCSSKPTWRGSSAIITSPRGVLAVALEVVSRGNATHLDHGSLEIMVDMARYLMQGFKRRAMMRLPLDAHDHDGRQCESEAGAHARA